MPALHHTFFLIAAAIIAIPALALLAWGFAADRIRGIHRRPRCRRCWYSLAGLDTSLPVTCPECGAVMKSTRDLHRPRIRRWPVRLAVLVLLAALPAANFAYPPLMAASLRYLPASLLIPLRPSEESEFSSLHSALKMRHEYRLLTPAHHRKLLKQSVARLRRLEGTEFKSDWGDSWAHGLEPSMWWIIVHPDREERERVIGAYLASDDVKLQWLGLSLAHRERWENELSHDLPAGWGEAIERILEADRHAGDEALVLDDYGVRTTPRMIEIMVDRATDPQPSTRRNISFIPIEAAARRGDPPVTPHLPRLLAALDAESDNSNWGVFDVLIILGPRAQAAAPKVEPFLQHPDPVWRNKAKQTLNAIRPRQ